MASNQNTRQELTIEDRIRRGTWIHAALTNISAESRGEVARLYDEINLPDTLEAVMNFGGLRAESADAHTYLQRMVLQEAGAVIEFYEAMPQ